MVGLAAARAGPLQRRNAPDCGPACARTCSWVSSASRSAGSPQILAQHRAASDHLMLDCLLDQLVLTDAQSRSDLGGQRPEVSRYANAVEIPLAEPCLQNGAMQA